MRMDETMLLPLLPQYKYAPPASSTATAPGLMLTLAQ